MKLETDGYKIESDGCCTTLWRIGSTKKGERKETAVGHYPVFAQALDRWLEEKIADSTAEDIRQLRGDIAGAKAEMRRMISAKKE